MGDLSPSPSLPNIYSNPNLNSNSGLKLKSKSKSNSNSNLNSNLDSVSNVENSIPIPDSIIRVCPPQDPSLQTSTASMILSLLKGIKFGTDLTAIAVPPVFNIPKSQLQMFCESATRSSKDYLGAIISGSSPLLRLLAVVRWHLSTTRQTSFGKAPYNPILGETHHVRVGDLDVLLEQVSHHPPISALRASSPSLSLSWWHQPTPRYYGSWVEAEIKGRRVLELFEPKETYESSSPRISFRFLPNLGTEWVGSTFVKCLETGLEAVVEFKPKAFFGMSGLDNRIGGKIFGKDKKTLYELDGCWDKTVTIKEVATGKLSTLYNYQDTVENLEPLTVEDPKDLETTETLVVWSKLTNSLLDGNFDTARIEKAKVENEQRSLRKKRKENGEIWDPKFFTFDNKSGNWVWKDEKIKVGKAPIIASTPKPCILEIEGK